METRRSVKGLFLLTALLFAVGTFAQQPKGVGGDIKPAKVKKVKTPKPGKRTPLYTVPKSAPWYQGGGPGIAGAK